MTPWSKMKRALVPTVLVAAVALASVAGAASAQGKLPSGNGWLTPLATMVAQAVGMDVQDVRAARRAGKSLAQIASERGVSEQGLIESVTKQVEERLNALVSQGTLGKEQADKIRSAASARLKALLNRVETGAPGAGRGLGLGRAMQRGFLEGYQRGWKQGFKCGLRMRASRP